MQLAQVLRDLVHEQFPFLRTELHLCGIFTAAGEHAAEEHWRWFVLSYAMDGGNEPHHDGAIGRKKEVMLMGVNSLSHNRAQTTEAELNIMPLVHLPRLWF